jgi:hypothetical protein
MRLQHSRRGQLGLAFPASCCRARQSQAVLEVELLARAVLEVHFDSVGGSS